MDKKSLRKTVSFSFNEDTIKKFNVYCTKKQLNRSRIVENLVIALMHEHTQPKDTTKEATNVVS